jgi:hypothetical protein
MVGRGAFNAMAAETASYAERGGLMHPSGFVEPCLPTISSTAPTGAQRAFEIKHNGDGPVKLSASPS